MWNEAYEFFDEKEDYEKLELVYNRITNAKELCYVFCRKDDSNSIQYFVCFTVTPDNDVHVDHFSYKHITNNSEEQVVCTNGEIFIGTINNHTLPDEEAKAICDGRFREVIGLLKDYIKNCYPEFADIITSKITI